MSPKKKAAPEFVLDYSGLQKGTRVQAENDGIFYSAEVVDVSTSKKRTKAPIKVHYPGYEDDWDEWVGPERLRSKAVKKVPAKSAKDSKKDDKGKESKPLEVEMGYWKIRGLGAVIRMILEYKGVKYTDNQYEDGTKWFKEDKPKILEKNPLANLPYIVCGNVCVCQTNSVLNYLGSRLRLNGPNPAARLLNDQLLNEIYDVRNGVIDLVYPFKKVSRSEEEYKESAMKRAEEPPFSKFEAILEKSGTDFFSASKPCTADFHIWEMLDQHKLMAAKMGKDDIFEKFPKCKAFHDRFRALPTLEKYFESDAYKLPCNNPMANAYFQ